MDLSSKWGPRSQHLRFMNLLHYSWELCLGEEKRTRMPHSGSQATQAQVSWCTWLYKNGFILYWIIQTVNESIHYIFMSDSLLFTHLNSTDKCVGMHFSVCKILLYRNHVVRSVFTWSKKTTISWTVNVHLLLLYCSLKYNNKNALNIYFVLCEKKSLQRQFPTEIIALVW